MSVQNQQSPRRVAATMLDQFDPQRQNLKDVLPKFLSQTDERNVLTDIAFGVIRNRQIIDTIIETVADTRIKRIQKKLLTIIRIGIFELVFTPDRADYAIVDAAVEGAKKAGGAKAGGFVNALLRNIGRSIKNRCIELKASEAAKTVIQNTNTGCEFNSAIVPDPNDNPASYLSTMFSLPQWLVEEWLGEFGFDKTKHICIASNRRPSVYIRPNTLRITPQQLYDKLQGGKIDCVLIAERGMIKLNNAGDVTKLPGFDEGLFVVQDLTASEAVKMLSPQPGWTVVDLCAAPGTKTTQLVELMTDSGTILATDIDQMRLKRVETACNRLQMHAIQTIPLSNLTKVVENGRCNAVLVDVPCSNTGVLSRRPEVRYRIKLSAITELTNTQLKLLRRAAELVKSGGKICYSTCSIQKQEDAGLVRQFLEENDNFVLSEEKLTLPSANDFDCDGGFAAILLKKQLTKSTAAAQKLQNQSTGFPQ